MLILFFLLLVQPFIYAASSSGQHIITSPKKSRAVSTLPIPPKNSSAFAMLKKSYTEALKSLQPADHEKAIFYSRAIDLSERRYCIMKCIEDLEKQREQKSSDQEAVSCGLICHWEDLRDTFAPNSIEYAHYNQRAYSEEQFHIFSVLTDNTSNPIEAARNQLTGLYEQITYYSNEESLNQAERTKLLSLVYTDIASLSQDIDGKQQAVQLSQQYGRMHTQLVIPAKISSVEASIDPLNDTQDTTLQKYDKLKRLLTKLRQQTASFSEEHALASAKLSKTALATLYYGGNIDLLQEDASENAFWLRERCVADQRLTELLSGARELQEERDALMDVLSTFGRQEPGYNAYANRILQLDLQNTLQALEAEQDSLIYTERTLALKKELLTTYHHNSKEHVALQEEIELLNASRTYLIINQDVYALINSVNDIDDVGTVMQELINIIDYSQWMNRRFKLNVPTDWANKKLEEYTTLYNGLADLNNLIEEYNETKESIGAPSHTDPQVLLRAIIQSPFIGKQDKTAYQSELLSIMPNKSIEDASHRIHFIRDEVLTDKQLTEEEKTYWNVQLSTAYTTREIRLIRNQLEQNDLTDSARHELNLKLKELYHKRNTTT